MGSAEAASRHRRAFLGWPAIGIVPMMIAAALYDPLSALGNISVAGVAVQPIDIGLACVVLTTLLYGLARTRWKPAPRPLWPTVTLVLLTAWPIVLGVVHGNELQSIMFQGRVAVYYALFFVYWQLIPVRRIAANLILVVVAIATVAAVYGLVAHIEGWQWVSGMSGVVTAEGTTLSRGYGWWSAFPWYVYGATAAFAYAWLGRASRTKRVLMALLSVGLVLSSLSTFIRGDVVGLVCGFAVVGYVGLRGPLRRTWIARRFWKSVPVAVLLTVVFVTAGVAFGGAYVDAVGERVSSIVAPRSSSTGSAGTRELRIAAMRDGLQASLAHPTGIGYGYAQGRKASVSTVNYLAAHNQLAWMGYFFGIAGVGVALACMVRIGMHLSRGQRREGPLHWAAVAATAILAAIVGQSLGAAYLFGSPHVYAIVPIFLAIGWIFRQATSEQAPRPEDA